MPITEIYYGPMFSGKTSAILAKVYSLEREGKKYKLFKPSIDKRFSKNEIVARTGMSRTAFMIDIDNPEKILEETDDVHSIIIDEAQFFNEKLIEVVKKLQSNHKNVIIAGLVKTYKAQPFGIMPQLIQMSDIVHKLKARCSICGEEAEYTQRLATEKKDVMVGDKEIYSARKT